MKNVSGPKRAEMRVIIYLTAVKYIITEMSRTKQKNSGKRLGKMVGRSPNRRARTLELRASPPFKPDILEAADVGGVRVVAVAEHGDVEQMRRHRISPDLGIDAGEINLLVQPAADPVAAASPPTLL